MKHFSRLSRFPRRALHGFASATGALLLAACGLSSTSIEQTTGSTGGSGSSPNAFYNVSGTISGLQASGLILSNNGATVTASAGTTNFTFGVQVQTGASYSVMVSSAPAGITCSVANGSGIMATANVNNVVVTCSGHAYTVGGTIGGLTSPGLLLINGSDRLSVPAGATRFTMSAAVADTSSYAVTVATQPTGQSCAVTAGTGTVMGANVTSVSIRCSDQPYALGGTISGLNGTGLVLANGSDTVTVPINATQFMLAPVAYGAHYAVTVATQPAGLTCTVSGGSGVMPAATVSVVVVCSDQSYTLGGSVSGLNVAGLVLANGTDTLTVPAHATSFTLPTPVAYKSSYDVTVATQPTGVTCTVSAGSGVMPAANVTSVGVTCSNHVYTLGGTITGLSASGLILTDGTDRVTVAANASQFSMPTGVAYTSPYTVTVAAQPAGLHCTVTAGTGTMPAADVTSVQVACVARSWTWEGGSDTVAGAQANYGVLGVAATSNVPGPRDSGMSWTDGAGKFWLFGGGGLDVANTQGDLNDLWSYDPTTRQWTWVGGMSTAGTPGIYGAKAVATVGSGPGARHSAMIWTDGAGRTWLFGGYGVDHAGNSGYLNDLWSYTPGTQQWVWMSGTDTVNGTATYGSLHAPAPANVPGARVGAVTWTDHAGHLWMFGGYDGTDISMNPIAFNDLWSYDPSTSQWTWQGGSSSINQPGNYGSLGMASATNVPGARLGAMGWTDAAGVFWLFGGQGLDMSSSIGYLNDLWSFDPVAQQWTWVSGASTVDANGVYGTEGVTASSNSPGAREGAVTWTDSAGRRWMLGGAGFDAFGSNGFLNDLWTFDPATQSWTWVNGSNTAPSNNGAFGMSGTYGTLGTAAAGNTPGGRVQGVSWIDGTDRLWTFGGYGYDGFGSRADLNDLWTY